MLKIGLALSGGGIRGVAHAGALKAFEENNIKFDIVGGTSSGSIVASLYSMGFSPYYIFVLFKRYAKQIIKINNKPIISGIGGYLKDKKISFIGLRDGINLEKMYDELCKKRQIEKIKDIKMPLVIPSVEIREGKEYVFTNYIPKDADKNKEYVTEISVGKAVRASSSFPGFFCPCKFNNHIFLDGGALDNIPVEEVRKQGANKVIALKFNSDDVDENSNIMDITMKAIDIMGTKIAKESIDLSDYLITINTDKVGLLDIEKLNNCYQYGYDAVINNIEEIKKIIS